MYDPIEIYTDGSCFPNPNGNGGWAFALSLDEYRSGYEKNTTSNRMELVAILEAIHYAKERYPNEPLYIFSDSQYCVNGFNQWMHKWERKNWKRKRGVVANLDLWKKLYDVHEEVTLVWVKGHNEDEMNDFVDALADYTNFLS
ncbi:MAG: ribonuclease HI [Candidatus Peribacteraceae bacterium]|nr:ribonuclease HI [Candidatus Peribacteraceae bacterium]